MTRAQLVKAYWDMLDLFPAEDREAAKTYVDDRIVKNRAYGLHMVAEIITGMVHSELGKKETRIPQESLDWGMFLTGGHTFYDYSASNAWIKDHGLDQFCRANVAY